MRHRQPVPILWLMTDERSDATLLAAIARLPRGSGIIFRHYATSDAERRLRFAAVRAMARRRGLVLLLAGSPREAIGWRADGWHGRRPGRPSGRLRLHTAPAHDGRELVAAARAGADLVFLSPIFSTRSHPGGRVLGTVRFGLLAGKTCVPVCALGGLTPERYRRLAPLGAKGWAAIDAWNG